MSYVLAIEDATPKQYDSVFEQEGVKILIDAKSHLYLDGTTVDFKNGLVGGGFEFQNPLAKKSCGCGTSFSA
ncbi:MAG: iron-sulfur cluster assembly accessory protein [Candidatus Omnitrophica bacterium]|nr:iron-sulfur cluster assembly accessory protein [Candidatus Omnitrophota bacterium]